MTINEIKTKVIASLNSNGILVDNNESIFLPYALIVNETESSFTLSAPHRENWIYFAEGNSEQEVDNKLEEYFKNIRAYKTDIFEVNSKISITAFVNGLAKLYKKEVPSVDLATTPLQDIVNAIIE